MMQGNLIGAMAVCTWGRGLASSRPQREGRQ